jgi:hypothetical protein
MIPLDGVTVNGHTFGPLCFRATGHLCDCAEFEKREWPLGTQFASSPQAKKGEIGGCPDVTNL